MSNGGISPDGSNTKKLCHCFSVLLKNLFRPFRTNLMVAGFSGINLLKHVIIYGDEQ